MARIFYRFLFVLALTLISGLFLSTNAQDFMPVFQDVALTPEYAKQKIQNGDVLSFDAKNGKIILTTKGYDDQMYGIAVVDPIIVYRTRESTPAAKTGTAMVNVTTLNGAIEIGDYLTSSPIPGKAQLAGAVQGYVLGVSLEKFDGKGGKDIKYEGKTYKSGQVLVSIGIGPASAVKLRPGGGLFGTLRYLLHSFILNLQFGQELEGWIRYLLAAIIALASIIVSFRYFGKNVSKGIEAIGRNPLAKVQIQTMITVNIVLIALVCLGGLIISLAILTL